MKQSKETPKPQPAHKTDTSIDTFKKNLTQPQPQPPIKSNENVDDKAVIADTTPRTEEIKINETAAREILEKFKDEHDDVNLKHLDSDYFIKLKELSS